MTSRVAVIGLGHQSTTEYIPALKDSQSAQLKAICDTDEEKVRRLQGELAVNGYVDYHDLLAREEIDFIIAATPHDMYCGIIEEACKRHIHVLKEKPFARSLEEAIHLKSICDLGGIQLMTTLQRRFNSVYQSFHHLKDRIGLPFHVEAKYTLFVDNPHEGWRADRTRAGGGCIIDMGYHMVDLIIWNYGLPDRILAEFSSAAKPDATYDAEDTALVLFGYDSGLYGSLYLSRYDPPKREFMRVIGNRGIIELERGVCRILRSNGECAETYAKESQRDWAAHQIDYFGKVVCGESENFGSPEYHIQHASFIDACYKSQQEKRYINPRTGLSNIIRQY